MPDIKDQPVQIIDVRDLARWCVELLENRVSGVFNTTGPQEPYTFLDVMASLLIGDTGQPFGLGWWGSFRKREGGSALVRLAALGRL